jgi:sugar lactone lactonase YvrE
MSRPKLSSPDQPLPIRLLLRTFEFAASLSLAVTLIFSFAFALGMATFVEAAWGTPVAQFYLYQAWWFEALLVLLGTNIFCAAAIRYPWKRHQTGFVITHIGLLTLLFAAFVSRSKGIDAQVTVFEGQSNKWAIDNAVDVEISVANKDSDGFPASERIKVDFQPGLFNWEDWQETFAFNKPEDDKIEVGRLPWQTFRAGTGLLFGLTGQDRPGSVLYDRDGVKLEVLDYYADSRDVQAPHLKLEISMPQATRGTAEGTQKAKATTWQPMQLSVIAPPGITSMYPYGWSQRMNAGGGYFTLQLAGTKGATQAFLKCLPEGELGEKGQAVLYVDGRVARIDVADKLGKGRFKLEGVDGVEAEVKEYWLAAALGKNGDEFEWQQDKEATKPTNPTVKIALYRGDKKLSDLLLFALESHSNLVDYKNNAYGAYWFNHGETGALTKEERAAAGVSARIDFLQGDDQTLYYRYWNREKIVFAREIETKGSPADAVDAFTMPIGTLKLYVKQFIPSDKPQVVAVKHEFVKDRLIGDPVQMGRQPAAKFALTVDGNREEFWLFPHLATPEAAPTNRHDDGQRIAFANGKNRIAAVTMPIKAIDIGFRVRLNKFERKLDPGTEQASHFASWVDFIDHDADRALATLEQRGQKPKLVMPQNMRRPTAVAVPNEDQPGLYIVDERSGVIRVDSLSMLNLDKNSAKYTDREVKGMRKPTALAVGPNSVVYFADRVVTGRRESGVLRKSDQETETIAQLKSAPTALALDAESQYLYFAGPGSNAIGRVNLKNNEVDETWYPQATRPIGLALDVKGGQLLWSEAGSNAIRRVKLDGSSDGLVLTRGHEEHPLSLAIDGEGERLYFLEAAPNPEKDEAGRPTSKPQIWRLMSAKLDGSDVRTECDEDIDEPSSLAIAPGGKPVWTQTSLSRDDVWITMNAPVDCFDPSTGRSYRLFQERFSGPFKPGQQLTSTLAFNDLVPADSPKTELYESVLTVNYDPGRGIRNVGCLLICCGIATMFYMRAYFFKTKPKQTAADRPLVKPNPLSKPAAQSALVGQGKR